MPTTSYTRAHQRASETTVGLLSARAAGESPLAATLLRDYLNDLETEGLDSANAFSRGWMSAIAIIDDILAASPDPDAARRDLACKIAARRA